MKILKYAYIPIMIITLLFVDTKANAATTVTFPTVDVPVTNGNNIQVWTQSYTDLEGTLIDAEDIQNTSQTWWQYDPTFTLNLRGTNQQWLNGYMSIDFYYSYSPLLSLASYDFEPISQDGIYVNIAYSANSYFRIRVFLDNVYNNSNQIELGQITLHFIDKETAYSATSATNFTTRLVNQDSNVEKSTTVINDRYTALLFSAINQATGPQLETLISLLTDIRATDINTYNYLINTYLGIHGDLGNIRQDLQNILNEIDVDFAAVQTVIDLFPSYRTQVLQYWQQLLEMNATQSSAAAELESQYADKDSQSSNLLGGLNSISYPSVNSGDFDIMGNADADSKANLFGLIGLITNNSFVTTVLIIIATGMIAGYALYGKK